MTPAPVGVEPGAEAEPGAKLGAKLEMDGAEPELPLADAGLWARSEAIRSRASVRSRGRGRGYE